MESAVKLMPALCLEDLMQQDDCCPVWAGCSKKAQLDIPTLQICQQAHVCRGDKGLTAVRPGVKRDSLLVATG